MLCKRPGLWGSVPAAPGQDPGGGCAPPPRPCTCPRWLSQAGVCVPPSADLAATTMAHWWKSQAAGLRVSALVRASPLPGCVTPAFPRPAGQRVATERWKTSFAVTHVCAEPRSRRPSEPCGLCSPVSLRLLRKGHPHHVRLCAGTGRVWLVATVTEVAHAVVVSWGLQPGPWSGSELRPGGTGPTGTCLVPCVWF